LLSLLKAHDERDKIELCYEKNKNLLVSYAFKITSNQAMAEDAVHSAFYSILQNKEKITSMSEIDLLKWCVISVKRKCIDQQRRGTRNSGLSIDELQDYLPSDSAPIDEHLAKKESIDHLKKSLNSMDETSQQILLMKYDLGMTMKEIGDELGFTPSQVNSRIARARKKLKGLMVSEVISYV